MEKALFSDRAIAFNQALQYNGMLPAGFQVLNPYLDNPETLQVMAAFYHQYYDDNRPRRFIMGINPGRHGAGVTGIPFTDTKRLASVCHIQMQSASTYEISSVFVYDMIAQYGGAGAFYKDFYINSPFPLAIIRWQKGKWVNANYYDDADLFQKVKPFMIESILKHISLGLDTDEVFVWGKKNAAFIEKLNRQEHFFKQMTVLDHPRFIQQYKSKEQQSYIDQYLQALQPL